MSKCYSRKHNDRRDSHDYHDRYKRRKKKYNKPHGGHSGNSGHSGGGTTPAGNSGSTTLDAIANAMSGSVGGL